MNRQTRQSGGKFARRWPISLVPHSLAILLYGLSAIAGAAPLDEPLKPLPEIPKQNSGQVELGRKLFSDPVSYTHLTLPTKA